MCELGIRPFTYCFVCVPLCTCNLIDIDITYRDNGVEFGIYVFSNSDKI